MKRSLDTVVLRALVVFLVAAVAVTWLLSAQSSAAHDRDALARLERSSSTAAARTTQAADRPPRALSTPGTVAPKSPRRADGDPTHNPDRAERVQRRSSFGLLLALASVGLSLIYGTTGLSNFAHGEQVSLGAMLAYFFATEQPVASR